MLPTFSVRFPVNPLYNLEGSNKNHKIIAAIGVYLRYATALSTATEPITAANSNDSTALRYKIFCRCTLQMETLCCSSFPPCIPLLSPEVFPSFPPQLSRWGLWYLQVLNYQEINPFPSFSSHNRVVEVCLWNTQTHTQRFEINNKKQTNPKQTTQHSSRLNLSIVFVGFPSNFYYLDLPLV